MMLFTATRTLLLTAPTLIAAPLAQADSVLTVDDDGPAEFSSLQLAIDAAQDGDLLFVRGGFYLGFTIEDRDLVLCAEPGAQVTVIGGVRVSNLRASRSVSLVGLTFGGMVGLEVTEADGPVYLEDCLVHGSSIFDAMSPRAVVIRHSSDVTFSHCTITMLSPGDSAAGLTAIDSNVQLFRCDVDGGEGLVSAVNPRDGGPAVRVEGGQVFLYRSTLQGGVGGHPMTDCPPGGSGAPALVLSAHAGEAPIVRVLDSLFQGGTGALGCPYGSDGAPIRVESGNLERLSGTARGFQAESPVQAGDEVALHFAGESADRVLVVTSSSQMSSFFDRPLGVLVPDRAGSVNDLVGVLPESGLMTVTRVADSPLGAPYLVEYLQPVFAARDGGGVLGPPRIRVTLTESL